MDVHVHVRADDVKDHAFGAVQAKRTTVLVYERLSSGDLESCVDSRWVSVVHRLQTVRSSPIERVCVVLFAVRCLLVGGRW